MNCKFRTMILFFVVFISGFKPFLQIELRPGQPVPNANILDQILTNNNIINSSNTNDGSVFDFLFGDGSSVSNKYNTDNLDVSVLDYQTVHKIVEVAKRNYEDSRRQYRPYWLVDREAYYEGPFFISKAFDMMKQSIYATRYRMEATKPFRKRFFSDVSYNIAILYGSLTQLLLRMDNMYAQMRNLGRRSHFIWYLIFYEKMLAAHVDVTSIVHRMFEFQKVWIEKTRSKDYEMALEKEHTGPPEQPEPPEQQGPPGEPGRL